MSTVISNFDKTVIRLYHKRVSGGDYEKKFYESSYICFTLTYIHEYIRRRLYWRLR